MPAGRIIGGPQSTTGPLAFPVEAGALSSAQVSNDQWKSTALGPQGQHGEQQAPLLAGPMRTAAQWLAVYIFVSMFVGFYSMLLLTLGDDTPCGNPGYFPQCMKVIYYNCTCGGSATADFNTTCIASAYDNGIEWIGAVDPLSLEDKVANATNDLYCPGQVAFVTAAQQQQTQTCTDTRTNTWCTVLPDESTAQALVGKDQICAVIKGDSLTNPYKLGVQASMQLCYDTAIGQSFLFVEFAYLALLALLALLEVFMALCTSYHCSLTPWRSEKKKSLVLLSTTVVAALYKIAISACFLYGPDGLVLTDAMRVNFEVNIAFSLGDFVWPSIVAYVRRQRRVVELIGPAV